ncbi:hypothetical protein PR003_g19035 [Phytophthora rubi]|uniref:Uncharacterized protein n=1 Tax=Phytophthora rubi TaxID=129364 RepID=A0A6A4DZQ3_9STRA|nr:hypothetical protein PR001_g18104 [Phytophthora rubi]KAE9315246.1 hypothetical protein PR003_g19035 [Phytophthora rubi]
MTPAEAQTVMPNTSSHSSRRRVAACANASPKLAIQWISTRGAWLLELTKAFAYIGTTTREDQSVGKVLAGYEAPDLPVATPTIVNLQHRLSVAEFGQVITLRDELYQHVLGSPEARYNVAVDVVDVTFASLLMHMRFVLDAAHRTPSLSAVQLTSYEYHLHRSIVATNARLSCHISTTTCCKWGDHLTVHWCTTNHAQVSNTVSGGDTLLASTMENILKQLVQINGRLARLEDSQTTSAVATADVEATVYSTAAEAAPPAPATPSMLAGCALIWYTNKIWETVNGKKDENKRADAKAAVTQHKRADAKAAVNIITSLDLPRG